jgi:hypothetical protein
MRENDDANRNHSAAIGIVNRENKDNYIWFFQEMKKRGVMKEVLEQDGLVLVNDRDKGLKAAVLQKIPCRHVLAVLSQFFPDEKASLLQSGFVEKWFPRCFLTSTIQAAYDERFAVRISSTNYTASDLLPPAANATKKKGRPSKDQRKRSKQQRHTGDNSGVAVKSRYCSKCWSTDHTVWKCPYREMHDVDVPRHRSNATIHGEATRIFQTVGQKLLPQQWQWAQTMLDLDEVEESDLELSDESGEEEEECGNLSWSFPELNEVASSVPEAVVAEAQESIAL